MAMMGHLARKAILDRKGFVVGRGFRARLGRRVLLALLAQKVPKGLEGFKASLVLRATRVAMVRLGLKVFQGREVLLAHKGLRERLVGGRRY